MCVSNACDAYSDIWNNHYDIYDFLGYHIRNKQTKKLVLAPLLCATAKVPIFAVCKNHGTRQKFELCRVPRLQGTRQIFGHIIVPGWLLYFAVGREWHTANPLPGCRVRFAVCGTRQMVCRGLLGLYRVPLAHGKGGLP